VKKERNQEELN